MADIMNYPLKNNFKYIQAPIEPDSDLRFEYSEQYEKEKQKLINRIVHSESGGCFLLTGYRGVGKTSFIDKVLHEAQKIELENNDGKHLIPIKINVAKGLEEDELMHQIIRRFYEELQEEIDDNIRKMLSKAYLRTLFKMRIEAETLKKHILSKVVTSGASGEISGVCLPLPFLNVKVSFCIEKTRNSSQEKSYKAINEASYLDYDAKSAETDFMNIVKTISNSKKKKLLPVFVLDELDKLTEEGKNLGTDDKEETKKKALASIQHILMNLKNVLSAPGVIFIIIAGIDFYDAVQKDMAREDSLYQSIFSYHFYLGKDWNIGDRLIKCFLKNPENDKEELALFSDYLEFNSKGTIRNALYTFNRFVYWNDNRAYLKFKANGKIYPEIEYYGSLNKALKKYFIHKHILDRSIKGYLTNLIKDHIIDIFYRKIDEKLDDTEFTEDAIQALLPIKNTSERIKILGEDERIEICKKIIDGLTKENWITNTNNKTYSLTDEKLKLKSKFRKGLTSKIQEKKDKVKRKLEELTNRLNGFIEEVKDPDATDSTLDTFATINTIGKILSIDPENQLALDTLEDLKDKDDNAAELYEAYRPTNQQDDGRMT